MMKKGPIHFGFARIVLLVISLLSITVISQTGIPYLQGLFASEQCINCGKTVFAPQIDPKIGVVVASGTYPDIHSGEYLYSVSKLAYIKGFRTMEIWMSPNICRANHTAPEKYPYDFYQSRDWCNDNATTFKTPSLAWLAQQQQFAKTLSLPFETIIITADSIDPNALTQDKIQNMPTVATKEQVQALYNDMYSLTTHLLQKYNNSGKTFIINTGNEIEFRITAKTGCYPNCEAATPDKVSVENMILWINTSHRAIADAKNAYRAEGVTILHTTEVSHVLTKKNGIKSSLTEVLPYVDVDLIGYSAHEARGRVIADTSISPKTTIESALNKIQQSSKHAGSQQKKVYISEIGFPEVSYGSNTVALNRFKELIIAAQELGTPYIIYWSFYDNECETFMPSKSQCLGLWIGTPDGDEGVIYQWLKTNSVKNAKTSKNSPLRNGATIASITVDGKNIDSDTTFKWRTNTKHTITATIKNTGTTTWSKNTAYALGLPATEPYILPIATRQSVTTLTEPGKFITFAATVTPNRVGQDTLQFQMLQEQLEWFGEVAPKLTIIVEK